MKTPADRIGEPRTSRPIPMTRMPRRLAGAASLAAVLMTAAAAMAQPGQQGLQPPIPSPPLNAPSHPLQMAVAVVLLVLVIGVNMIPSKRGHQD